MKYHILATKSVELRGSIQARTLEQAEQKAKDHWQIYDTSENTITAGTSEQGGATPVISEHPRPLRIIHTVEVDD